MEIPSDLLALASLQGGVLTTGQALERGLAGRDVGRLRARGRLVRIRWGAYAVREEWDGWDARERHRALARAVALQLTTPYTFSHVTAAVLHDLPLHRVRLDEVHVTRADGPGRTRRQAGICHHDGPLPAPVLLDGLPTSDLVRTAFDTARVARFDSAVVTMDAALRQGASTSELAVLLDDTERWPGSAQARRAFAAADGRAESPGETVARLAFAAVGMAPTTLQLELTTDAGEVRTDFGWPESGLVGEFDGRIKYGRLLKPGQTTEEVLVKERLREQAIERAGWGVVRFTWPEVHELPLVRDRLREALARARARGGHRLTG